MLTFILRKLAQGAIMLLAVSSITFVLLSRAGGDALSSLRDNPQVSERTITELRTYYGLDRPFIVRYGSWLASAAVGDLGESLTYKTPVSELIRSKFFYTLQIGLAALTFCLGLSLGLGLMAARFKTWPVTVLASTIVALSSSAPQIVVAVVSLAIAAKFAGGVTPIPTVFSLQFILGALALGLPLLAYMLAQFRSSLDEAEGEDFVRLAHAKGLREGAVLVRHALRAALNPFITVSGLAIGALMGGSVIVETILGWPGIGFLLVNAVRTRDVPLVMGIVMISSLAVWIGNTAAELLHAWNDPRGRASQTTRSRT
jgi:peptide/nickel transport system permease protein